MSLFLVVIYALNLAVLPWLVYRAYLSLEENPLKKYYLPGLLFKVASGIALGLLYSFYYKGGDTFLFFEKARALLALPADQYLNEIFLTSIPHEERSVLPMTKITSLILVLTGKNYWLTTVYFSLFSFAGTFYFLNALSAKYPALKNSAALAFLFFPSVVFWSSGILKESLVFGIMLFMMGFLFRYLITQRLNPWHLIFTLVGGWLMLLLKYYIAAVFLPTILILFVVLILQNVMFFKSAKPIYQYLVILIVGIGALFWATTLQFNLDLSRIYSTIKTNQIEILSISGSSDAINYFDDTDSLLMIFVNLFIALFSGLFRPLIPDFSSFAQILASAENLVIFGLFIVGLRRQVVLDKPNKILLIALILYVMILATLLSYSSPNFGTLARYKVYFMPFFVFMILIKNPLVVWLGDRHSNSSS